MTTDLHTRLARISHILSNGGTVATERVIEALEQAAALAAAPSTTTPEQATSAAPWTPEAIAVLGAAQPVAPAGQAAAGVQGEVAFWVLREQLEARVTTCNGRMWFSDPVNSAWVPVFLHPAPAVERGVAEEQTAAARDVLAERQRQVSVEGWTPEHDDEHGSAEMAQAAACYALNAAGHRFTWPLDTLWPWSRGWWKPSGARRDLVKAGALILAEIERLDRAALSSAGKEQA